ncbi:short chain dehydrogenase family protein [Aspergillus niger]|uniref:Short chain dehydrogenase family protein n=1 Tax=Aspergillus niger TaxID=5061 RepID=A0A505HRI6_ASPNG|nr:short chain dehydrogenase family protein [Aspergillus niger]
MDRTPTSFPSSPVAHSARDDQRLLKASPAYPSPAPIPLDRYDFQSLSGLGISNCGTGSPSSQIRLYPCPEQYALSTSNWSDPITHSPNILETPPDASRFPPSTHYEPFGSHADISVSPSYSPVMDFGAMHDEIPRFWPNTPTSETMAASEGWSNVDVWESSFLDDSTNTMVSRMPEIPRLQLNTAYLHPQRPDNTLTELDPSQSVAPDLVPDEAISKWIENVSESPHGEQSKIPSIGEYASMAVRSVVGATVDRTHCQDISRTAAMEEPGRHELLETTQMRHTPLMTITLHHTNQLRAL